MSASNPRLASAKQFVAGLRDEVKELHPWLEELFHEMPGVSNVNCRQGSQEFGADFVLEREDGLLGTRNVVGVVVKAKQIVQNDYEVQRQANECFNMQKSVLKDCSQKTVTEVWVITSQSFSGNARDALVAHFVGRNVKFIGGAELAGLALEHAPHLLTSVPFELSGYLSGLLKEVEAEENRCNPLFAAGLNSSIPQQVQRVAVPYEEEVRIQRRVPYDFEKVLSFKGGRVFTIEGVSGAGKSTLVRGLIRWMCDPDQFLARMYLPIRIKVRNEPILVEDCLEAVIDAVKSTSSSKKFESVVPVLVIDGLERAIPLGDERLAWLADLDRSLADLEKVDRCRVSPKAIVTCWEIELPAGGGQDSLLRHEIVPPRMADILTFIREYCRGVDIESRVWNDIKSSPIFAGLKAAPAAAVLLAELIREQPGDLPRHLTELYSRYTEWALGRWSTEAAISSSLIYQTATGFLSYFAFELVQNSSVGVAREEWVESLGRYLHDKNSDVSQEDLRACLRDSGIVVFDDSEGAVCFRSILMRDYFAAMRMQSNDVEHLIGENFLDPLWPCVWFFYFGQRRDCPAELGLALGVEPSVAEEALLKLILVPECLLAAHQTDYSVAKDAVAQQMEFAASLYVQCVNGEAPPLLAHYSPMQLLWIFQNALRTHYGHEYFSRAVSDVGLLGECVGETGSYARLFQALVLLELGADDPFRCVLGTGDVKQLPVQVLLAIRHEATGENRDSAIVRKALKRLGRFRGAQISKKSPFSKFYSLSIGASPKALPRQ